MWRAGVDNAESSAAAYTRSCGPWPTNISVSAFRHRRCNKTRLRNRARRNPATKNRVSPRVIECVCSVETIQRHRVESRCAAHLAALSAAARRIRSVDGSPTGSGCIAYITRAVACASARLRATRQRAGWIETRVDWVNQALTELD